MPKSAPSHSVLPPIVAYYRVSTQKQGRSGLGLEAQRAAVRDYAKRTGQRIVSEHQEIETGTCKRHRPILDAAIEQTRAVQGVLVIAKLDRLARNVAFIEQLKQAGVPFKAADMPDVDNMTIQIYAVVAEQEARLISERTKAGLKAYRARGGILGKPENMTEAVRMQGRQTIRDEERRRNRQATGYATLARGQGQTLQAIADGLQRDGYPTANGGRWTPTAVRRLLVRAAGRT